MNRSRRENMPPTIFKTKFQNIKSRPPLPNFFMPLVARQNYYRPCAQKGTKKGVFEQISQSLIERAEKEVHIVTKNAPKRQKIISCNFRPRYFFPAEYHAHGQKGGFVEGVSRSVVQGNGGRF